MDRLIYAQANSDPSKPAVECCITQKSMRVCRPGRKVSLAGIGAALFVLTNLGPDMTAQTVGGTSANSRIAFEVASIRADKSEGRPISDFPIGPGRVYVPREGIFRATHVSLIQYIGFAYKLTHSQMAYLADHVPDWVLTEGFDITARVEGKPSEDQLRLMMQSLLEERFKLAIHKQGREVPVLALVLVKAGATGQHLLPHSSDPPCPKRGPYAEERETVSGGFPLACHGIVMLPPSAPGRDRLGARDITLSFLADALSGSAVADLGRPLIDRTGLTGTFDFTLECTPEMNGSEPPDGAVGRDTSGPTFREALKEQLGLKLESQKSTMEVFVMDHVDHPTEN